MRRAWIVERDVLRTIQQPLDRHPGLHACQLGADAEMDTVAEGEVVL